MPRQVTAQLTVVEVDEHTVLCDGVFATADGKGTHSHVRPRLFHTEIGAEDPSVGDAVVQYDDGSYEHRSVPHV